MFTDLVSATGVATSLLILVSGCGGGGGLGVDSANVNVLAIDPVLGGVVLRSGGGEITVVGERTAPDVITLRLGSESATFDTAQGDSISGSDSLFELSKGDLSADGMIDLRNPYVTSARLRTAMDWTAPTSGVLTVEVDGMRSGAANLPEDDTVTYTGEAIGYFHWDPEGLDYIYATRSDMTLTAFFASGTIDLETRNSVGYRPSTGTFAYAPINADGTGEISGGSFQGTLTNGLGGTGSFSGSFYGPAGENVGGTIEYDGSLAVGVASFSGG